MGERGRISRGRAVSGRCAVVGRTLERAPAPPRARRACADGPRPARRPAASLSPAAPASPPTTSFNSRACRATCAIRSVAWARAPGSSGRACAARNSFRPPTVSATSSIPSRRRRAPASRACRRGRYVRPRRHRRRGRVPAGAPAGARRRCRASPRRRNPRAPPPGLPPARPRPRCRPPPRTASSSRCSSAARAVAVGAPRIAASRWPFRQSTASSSPSSIASVIGAPPSRTRPSRFSVWWATPPCRARHRPRQALQRMEASGTARHIADLAFGPSQANQDRLDRLRCSSVSTAELLHSVSTKVVIAPRFRWPA